jgi:hypothetical protein
MTWEQLSLFTDEELGLQGPKEIQKTVAIQLSDLRNEIATTIEDELDKLLPPIGDVEETVYQALSWAASVARGTHAKSE